MCMYQLSYWYNSLKFSVTQKANCEGGSGLRVITLLFVRSNAKVSSCARLCKSSPHEDPYQFQFIVSL
jgi:hypothetical protein